MFLALNEDFHIYLFDYVASLTRSLSLFSRVRLCATP